MPLAGHALELMVANIREFQARSRHEVGNRGRRPDLSRFAAGQNSSRNDDGQPTDLFPRRLDLTGMDARPDPKAEGGDRFPGGHRALDEEHGPGELEGVPGDVLRRRRRDRYRALGVFAEAIATPQRA